jgi:hypothetical protein
MARSSLNALLGVVAFSVLLGVFGVVGFGFAVGWNPYYARHIQTDTQDRRSVIDSTFLFTAGNGISIVNGNATNELVFSSPNALVNVTGGPGLTTSTSPGGVVTINNTLSMQAQLGEADPNGPNVEYNVAVTAVPDNTWQTGVMTVVAGDDGQGNVGGTSWVVPAVGTWAVSAHCMVTPSSYIKSDRMVTTVQVRYASIVPAGGSSSLNLYSPVTVAPALSGSQTVNGIIHACPTCLVHVGDALTLRARLDHNTDVAPPPSMGTAAVFGILSATSITNTGASTVQGDVGDTGAGGSITGFPPGTATGVVHPPNDAASIAAISDIIAFNAALNAIPCTQTYTSAMNIGGMTFTPGVYCFTSSVAFTGAVVIDGQGNPNARFIFRSVTTLTGNAGSSITFANSARPCGVTWQVGTGASFSGAAGTMAGNVIAQTIITATAGWTFASALYAPTAGVGAITLNTNGVFNTGTCAGGLAPITTDFACTLQANRIN